MDEHIFKPYGNKQQQEAVALKKALEWELNLDLRDLRSHAWYHGPLIRQRAEEIVCNEGEFLIRDCISQPDNYVLTCCTKSTVLHFVINKILVQPETVYERIQYQFEEEAFDTIPDLITFYVGSGRPISLASGVRIQYPRNRLHPLSFYGHKIVGNQLYTEMITGAQNLDSPNSPCSNNTKLLTNGNKNLFSTKICGKQYKRKSSPTKVTDKQTLYLPHLQRPTPCFQSAQRNVIINSVKEIENIKNAKRSVFCADEADGGEMGGEIIAKCSPANTNLFKSYKLLCKNTPEKKEIRLFPKLNSSGYRTIARCTAGADASHHHMKFTTHSLPRYPNSNTLHTNLNHVTNHIRDFQDLHCKNQFCNLDSQHIHEFSEQFITPSSFPLKLHGFTNYKINSMINPGFKPAIFLDNQYGIHRTTMATIYQQSESDSGNGSGDSLPSDNIEFIVHHGVIIRNPRFIASSTSLNNLKLSTEFDPIAVEMQLYNLNIPIYKPMLHFDVDNFTTLLLPTLENKPLDGEVLNTFKVILLETGSKLLAEHLTRLDIDFLITQGTLFEANSENNGDDSRTLFADVCGLELLTLTEGKVIRNHVIERTQCLKLMVAVSVLTCQTDIDRAEILSKWIQIAVESKTALGNLFGFACIMLGLCMPQIEKLHTAWRLLRQKYTDDAFIFEAKLRPTLINMNECSNPQAPNTTVPHVLLYVILKDRTIENILKTNTFTLHNMCITSWESKADDFGLSINYQHLDASRSFLNNLTYFRKNANLILEESSARMDELINDIFRTEFHIKFLWGSKGAAATMLDRHSNMERVLTIMADKFYQQTITDK